MSRFSHFHGLWVFNTVVHDLDISNPVCILRINVFMSRKMHSNFKSAPYMLWQIILYSEFLKTNKVFIRKPIQLKSTFIIVESAEIIASWDTIRFNRIDGSRGSIWYSWRHIRDRDLCEELRWCLYLRHDPNYISYGSKGSSCERIICKP